MSLESRVNEDMKTAMKSKDQAALRAVRAIKAAILVKKTDGSGDEIDADIEIKILQKLVKSRKESLDIYQKQDRADLAIIEEEEIAVIEKYLPHQLSEDEVNSIVQKIITDLSASSMKDMGKVMSEANNKLAGQADGRLIANLVKKKLQGQG